MSVADVLTTPGVSAAIAARSPALSSGSRLTRSCVTVRPVPAEAAVESGVTTTRSNRVAVTGSAMSTLMRSDSARRATVRLVIA